MTINASDIRLLESEVMADTTDGGGRRTSRVIADGVSGNIFPKVSRLDSVYGRVNLRKVYGAVQTANTDTYAGAHAIITDAPDNERIHTTLFSTGSEFDTRVSARDRIESYVTSGPESRAVLLGRQLPGQQTFLAYQRTDEPIPEIGNVYCLSNEAGGVVASQQYVRIQEVTHEVRTFEDLEGTFERRVITVNIGVALRYEFNGPDSASRLSNVPRASRLRETTVVDAARYFGIKKLVEPAFQNDLSVRVSSVYSSIVPTTNRETAVANERISDATPLIKIAQAPFETVLFSTAPGAGDVAYLPRLPVPGTVSLRTWAWGNYDSLGTDNGSGNILENHGGYGLGANIDYETGSIAARYISYGGGGDVLASFIPAVAASQPAHTRDVEITLGNVGTVYVIPLRPLPAPMSVIVDYRALGKWYRLRDDGAGAISGADAAFGLGSIDYASGSLVVSLGALPDVGSSLLVSFGSPSHNTIRAGDTSDAGSTVRQTFTLPDAPILPGSFSAVGQFAPDSNYGVAEGILSADANGSISGTGNATGTTGTINYTTGAVTVMYGGRPPLHGSTLEVSYQQITPADPLIPVGRTLNTASSAAISLGGGVVPGSFIGALTFYGTSPQGLVAGSIAVSDAGGAGVLMAPEGQRVSLTGGSGQGAVTLADTIVGTINYTTGEVTVTSAIACGAQYWVTRTLPGTNGWSATGANTGVFIPAEFSSQWESREFNIIVGGGNASLAWQDSGAGSTNDPKAFSVAFTDHPLRMDLTRTTADRIVPGSVTFTYSGKLFIDRDGKLYANIDGRTNSGLEAGSINYATGEIQVTYWGQISTDPAAFGGVTVYSCLTTFGSYSAHEFFFRAPGSPLRPGSFYLQANATDGTLLSGTTNDNGEISGVEVQGYVNQETGVARVIFGKLVAAAGNEAEPWYLAENVSGGQIFRPTQVDPSTLAYSCVVLANLPLNADILGLDPVRLPADGRVPIYRPADVVVIHNTKATTLANPLAAGATYSSGRTYLSELWLVDQQGARVPSTEYTVNLTAGTVTMSAGMSLSGLVQPIIAKHRIEEMNLVTDVQINGAISLTSPLSREYDADTLVSSALLFGDMISRVVKAFDLNTWETWSDTPGEGAQAQYNNLDYPIEVLNSGGVSERWRISFTTDTDFHVIGENAGFIDTGNTGADCSPTNQLTGQPYFVIRAAGWGSGWAAGNQLRFNAASAAAPMWIARTVLPGATLAGDSFSIQMRGDVDAD